MRFALRFSCCPTGSTARPLMRRSNRQSSRRGAPFDAFEATGDDVGMAEAAIVVSYLEYVRATATGAAVGETAMLHALAAGAQGGDQAAGDLVGIAIVGPFPFIRSPSMPRSSFSLAEPIADAAATS